MKFVQMDPSALVPAHVVQLHPSAPRGSISAVLQENGAIGPLGYVVKTENSILRRTSTP